MEELVKSRLLEEMKRFAEGAWEFSKFPLPPRKPPLADRHLSSLDYANIDLFAHEYLRSLDFKSDKYLFALDIETFKHKGEWIDGVIDSVLVSTYLAKMFPKAFEYHLSGNGVHACAVIDYKDKNFKKDYVNVDAKAIHHYASMVCEGIGAKFRVHRRKEKEKEQIFCGSCGLLLVKPEDSCPSCGCPDIDKYLCRKIYSQGRIFKLPGSINFSATEKCGKPIFCVPFTPDMSIEQILDMSQLRTPCIQGTLPKFSVYGVAKKLTWKQGRGSPKVDLKKINVPAGMRFDIVDWPPCLLSELNVPEPSHYWRVSICKYLYSMGYSVEEICGFFKALNPKDYDETRTKYQVNYDYGKMMSGCQTVQIVYGLCVGECGRLHPLDKMKRKEFKLSNEDARRISEGSGYP